jgi:hypothetical protein
MIFGGGSAAVKFWWAFQAVAGMIPAESIFSGGISMSLSWENLDKMFARR